MKLLLAVDLRHEGHPTIVQEATRWAVGVNAQLDLIFIDPFGDYKPPTLDAVLRSRIQSELEATRNQDRAHLDTLRDGLPEALRGETEVLSGNPAVVLAERSTRYDAVMMGAGKTGISKFFLGSVAERTVRQATCTVIILRPPANKG